MKRDINRVLAYIIRHVIPRTETEVIDKLTAFYKECFYIAPECQSAGVWVALNDLLVKILGNPTGCEWKIRIGKILCNDEKIPDDFHELHLT